MRVRVCWGEAVFSLTASTAQHLSAPNKVLGNVTNTKNTHNLSSIEKERCNYSMFHWRTALNRLALPVYEI